MSTISTPYPPYHLLWQVGDDCIVGDDKGHTAVVSRADYDAQLEKRPKWSSFRQRVYPYRGIGAKPELHQVGNYWVHFTFTWWNRSWTLMGEPERVLSGIARE